jgi:NADH-quinone oxidoreductase subunit M
MPVYAVALGFFSLASLGLPMLSGFVGEFLVLLGAFSVATGVGVAATIGVVLAAAYMLWMYQRVMFGQIRTQALATLTDVNRVEAGAFISLGVLVVWIGVYPATFVTMISSSTAGLVG